MKGLLCHPPTRRYAAAVAGLRYPLKVLRSGIPKGGIGAGLDHAVGRIIGDRPDVQGEHHLVVLVLDDVAVPHVAPRDEEPGLDPGDFAGLGDDGVLDGALPRLGRSGGRAAGLHPR